MGHLRMEHTLCSFSSQTPIQPPSKKNHQVEHHMSRAVGVPGPRWLLLDTPFHNLDRVVQQNTTPPASVAPLQLSPLCNMSQGMDSFPPAPCANNAGCSKQEVPQPEELGPVGNMSNLQCRMALLPRGRG